MLNRYELFLQSFSLQVVRWEDVSGTVDQSDQGFLEDGQVSSGYSFLCVAYATSDLVIRSDY